MKKLALAFTLVAVTLTGNVSADIQSPPGSHFTPTRKLGRGISNILYGFMEIPTSVISKNSMFGRKAEPYGAVAGISKTFQRLGYGFYEVVTFHCPTYRGTFKQPYERCGQDGRVEMDPTLGLSEFPPQLGFGTQYRYSRSQAY